MACLIRYRWLKLPRALLPSPKGVSGYWSRLAARAAFRKGIASYCGHRNPVEPGTWVGGIVNDEAVLSFLRERGILADESITPQQVEEKKRKEAYHNTLLLLSNYRNILWQTDSELDTIAAELNLPLQKLDAVLSRIDAEIGMGNRRLELRLERLAKTRQLLDRINDALTSLKRKPDNGPLLYELIYLTYIGEEKLVLNDILYRLNISRRHYYRLKEQAVSTISLRLWSAPTTDLEIWLGLVSMLTDKN